MDDNPSPIDAQCRICQNPGPHRLFHTREMMYGTRQAFDYFQCQDCGCLQICDVPDDLGAFYPSGYYSYNVKQKRMRPWVKWQRAVRSRYAIERKGFLGPLLNWRARVDPILIMYGDIGVQLSDAVLDVGGGGGGHVQKLRLAGFENVLAIDPFLPNDVIEDDTVIARKQDIFTCEGQFDLIAFHHSFEHMDGQHDLLRRCHDLLTPRGRVLIRVPTISSDAWDTYGTDWVSLDPPRHLYLHSHDSIRRVADDVGFEIAKLWCDSDAFQFWGSEQYKKDIPLTDPTSYANDPGASMFSSDQIAKYDAEAEQLNDTLRGDCLCVLLQPRDKP